MSKVLHIEASPRGDRSASTTVAKRFIDTYRAQHPHDVIETMDLWKTKLPEIGGATLNAKYAGLQGQKMTHDEAQAWKEVTKIAEHFKSADKYVFSLPMWNFGIPYKLKHYFDVIVQAGLTFSYSPDTGYAGLVKGKPAVAIYARGGAYAPGTGAEGYDQQSPYLRQILGFVGFKDIKEVFIEPTAAAPGKDKAVADATPKTDALAAGF